MKALRLFIAACLITAACTMTAFAAGNTTTSGYWWQGPNGEWRITKDLRHVHQIQNSWVCDDANNGNQSDNWYLIDPNGLMYEGIICDENGNYYLLDPNHTGTYGKMVVDDGFQYNGIQFRFNQSHDGTFGKILNTEAVSASGLKVTSVNLGGKAFLYTSQFGAGQGAGQSAGGNNGAGPATRWGILSSKYLKDYSGEYSCTTLFSWNPYIQNNAITAAYGMYTDEINAVFGAPYNAFRATLNGNHLIVYRNNQVYLDDYFEEYDERGSYAHCRFLSKTYGYNLTLCVKKAWDDGYGGYSHGEEKGYFLWLADDRNRGELTLDMMKDNETFIKNSSGSLSYYFD